MLIKVKKLMIGNSGKCLDDPICDLDEYTVDDKYIEQPMVSTEQSDYYIAKWLYDNIDEDVKVPEKPNLEVSKTKIRQDDEIYEVEPLGLGKRHIFFRDRWYEFIFINEDMIYIFEEEEERRKIKHLTYKEYETFKRRAL